MAGDIVNGSFEDGLTGWRIVSGAGFWNQPVQAASIGAQDVLIDGRPPVTLGGDYWYTNAFPLGQDGSYLIKVVTEKDGDGILDSVPFTITQRYLAYRLGGTAGGDAALEVRVPRDDLPRLIRVLDAPDEEGYVAVLAASPDGSDILREDVLDFLGPDNPQTLIGMTAKLRLRVSDEHGPGRLLVSDLRQVDEKPAGVRRPLWGWADIHCHPMAHAGSGNLLAGHIHGPVEDIGSCLEVHGHQHGNPLHPTGMALDGGLPYNDGSLATTGWSTTKAPGPEEQGFRGWPAFDELTHLKTHQDWIKRAYEGGLRLMVALVVHNQLLAALSTGLDFIHAQTDRDAIEPQVHMLHEFVAHNKDWCGLATTPEKARELIEDNKLAFVLGLETDTINGWSKFTDFPTEETDATRPAVRQSIHEKIHAYFQYLNDLGIVQVNLIHLSDNAFGGMALYDFMFIVNTFMRSGRLVDFDDGYLDQGTGNPRPPGEAISLQVDFGSKVWQSLQAAAAKAGFTAPDLKFTPVYGHGQRNKIGLLPAGEEAVLEAMRFGMVIDMDHMSERATAQAYHVVTTEVPPPDPAQACPYYPLVAAHNGARRMMMTPPAQSPLPGTTPGPDERRSPHTWPNESTKSDTQLGYIKDTCGMFGHGIAGKDSKQHGSINHDAAGTSKTVAQGLQYVMDQLDTDQAIGWVGLGTDWNILLGGPGPRFGPMAIPGFEGELDPDDAWAGWFRTERLQDATSQTHAVAYEVPLRDWRSYRFRETGLYKGKAYEVYGRFIWQALALQDTGADLTSKDVVDALNEPGWGHPALDLALGLKSDSSPMGPSVYFQAGAKSRNPGYQVTGNADEVTLINNLVTGITDIKVLWERVKTSGSASPPLRRSTAGPIRDFDYNLDGLGHYGMLPDMLQDMKNVGLPAERFTSFFASAERYIQVWERCAALAATIPHPPVTPLGPGGGP